MQYIGVDYHKRTSYLFVMDENGERLREGRISNTRGSLHSFLNSIGSNGKTEAVLEAGRNWTVMHDWLESEVDEVKLAHPTKVKAIAEAKIKTDKIDARTLAHLLRSDLIPEAYVPGMEARKVKRILRQRMFFVKLATMVKNRIHTIVDRYPEIGKPTGISDLFGKQGRRWLSAVDIPSEDRKLLDEELQLLGALDIRIKASDNHVRHLGKSDPKVKRLMTIPGIGRFFALLVSTEIDDIHRFRHKGKLCSYAGLVPSTYSSGDRLYHGRITKQGNKWLRWAMVEAVWPAIRKDMGLRKYYESIKRRKGANAAKVATARRLLTIVYQVLSQDRDYIEDYPGCPQHCSSGS